MISHWLKLTFRQTCWNKHWKYCKVSITNWNRLIWSCCPILTKWWLIYRWNFMSKQLIKAILTPITEISSNSIDGIMRLWSTTQFIWVIAMIKDKLLKFWNLPLKLLNRGAKNLNLNFSIISESIFWRKSNTKRQIKCLNKLWHYWQRKLPTLENNNWDWTLYI